MGKFEYNINEKTKIKGNFNIYQARSGAIILAMESAFTILELRQVEELKIGCYDLQDFNNNKFKKFYNIDY